MIKVQKLSDADSKKQLTLELHENGDVRLSIDMTTPHIFYNSLDVLVKSSHSLNTIRALRDLMNAIIIDEVKKQTIKDVCRNVDWEPEYGEKYWYWSFGHKNPKETQNNHFEVDYTLIYNGNCFRDEQSCMEWAKKNRFDELKLMVDGFLQT